VPNHLRADDVTATCWRRAAELDPRGLVDGPKRLG